MTHLCYFLHDLPRNPNKSSHFQRRKGQGDLVARSSEELYLYKFVEPVSDSLKPNLPGYRHTAQGRYSVCKLESFDHAAGSVRWVREKDNGFAGESE